ncbi:hypothetical protein EVAR_77965_1, partial [Eumeta japonica]
MPGRLLVGDTTPTQVMVFGSIETSCRSSRRPTRARGIAQAPAGWRLRRGWCSTRRSAQLTQSTAGGRTLVDADRIKAARIGDPRWRRSDRARLPTADQAIHASDGSSQGSTCRAASLNLFFSLPLSWCRSGAYAGPPAARHRACAHGRVGAPGCEGECPGREARNRPTRSRPPVVGRWWTPTGSRRHASVTRVGVDLTERLPTADQAIHASDGGSQGSTCQRARPSPLLLRRLAICPAILAMGRGPSGLAAARSARRDDAKYALSSAACAVRRPPPSPVVDLRGGDII